MHVGAMASRRLQLSPVASFPSLPQNTHTLPHPTPPHPPQTQAPPFAPPAAYTSAAAAALRTLGLSSRLDPEADPRAASRAYAVGLRSGCVGATLLAGGSGVGEDHIAALLAAAAAAGGKEGEEEAAGAAFVTLACLLGAGADVGGAMLEATYGLPPGVRGGERVCGGVGVGWRWGGGVWGG
jgi:hypothetical protein